MFEGIGAAAGVRLRFAGSEDAPAIGQMLDGIMRDHAESPQPLDGLVEGARRILALPHARFLLAVVGDEPVGMVQITERFSTWRLRPFCYLDDFYVKPVWRSRRVGAALLAGVRRYARSLDAVRVDLDVWGDNHAAIAFYLREGFVDTGERLLRLDVGDRG